MWPKNCANLFLSELRDIFTKYDNFWQKDGKGAEIVKSFPTSPNFVTTLPC